MKLYHDTRAPNPRRARIFLAEKGVEVELIEVSIASRGNDEPGYRAKNPLGLLPALELDDGRVLCESIAICRYIEELYPDPPLFGVDAWDRAQVEQWNRHAELELLWPVAQTFRNTHGFWAGRIPQAPEFGAIARDLALERLAWFDQVLASRPFLAGSAFTVADITALCAIDFGKISGIRIPPEQSHLQRWYREVSSRPSAKA
jgi:glutathione S-transferase